MALAIDTTASADGDYSVTLSSPSFSTAGPNELILVLVECTQQETTNSFTVTVGGNNATYVTSQQGTTPYGVVSLFTYWAASQLSSVTATVSDSTGIFNQTLSITVVALSGTLDGSATNGTACIGATSGTSFSSVTNPTVSVTTTAGNSWVFGNVFETTTSGTSATVGSGQTAMHQYSASASSGQMYVIEQNTATASSGTNVSISITFGTSVSGWIQAFEVLTALAAPKKMAMLGVGP